MADRHLTKILIVEDDREIAAAMRHRLVHEGYAATVAVDGLEALHAFDAERPDLVTGDLNVPAISGYRLVRLFKSKAPEIPILVVTSASYQEAEELAKVGVDGFIIKPFRLHDLVQDIESCLARRPRPERLGRADVV